MGYVLIIAISVAVGVGVYRLTANLPVLDLEQEQEMWAGAEAAPAEQAPPPPPTNFERLSISHDRLTWHDRIIGSLGLLVAVAVGAAILAFAAYLAGSTLIGLLEKAAGKPT
jgi:hypothetical protein